MTIVNYIIMVKLHVEILLRNIYTRDEIELSSFL